MALCIAAVNVASVAASQDAAPTPWISLFVSEEAVRSLDAFEVIATAEGLEPDAAKQGVWEIRSTDCRKRVARVPYGWPVVGERVSARGRFSLNKPQLRRIGPVDEGEYLLAWHIGDRRCSNVVRFRIDKEHDRTRLPRLELAEIEPELGQQTSLLGIRARRHVTGDPAPLASQVAFTSLIVDGERRQLNTICWIGADGPLQVGRHYAYILDLRQYRPPIRPARQSVVIAQVGAKQSTDEGLRSPPLTLACDHRLGEVWDRATAALGPVPPTQIALTGTVIGSDGALGRGYEAHLIKDGKLWLTTKVDLEGEYAFYSVPAGKYELATNPPGQGQPQLVVHEIALDGKEVRRLDLSLERQFAFSGRVTYADGTPTPDHTVMATWNSPDGLAEFADCATTDAEGRYTLAAPYEVASFVGWGGKQVRRNVKAGRDDVGFVAKKGAAE